MRVTGSYRRYGELTDACCTITREGATLDDAVDALFAAAPAGCELIAVSLDRT